MANTTVNGPVRATKGFQIATRDARSDDETTRVSTERPDLTGVTLTATASDVWASSSVSASRVISVVTFAISSACASQLVFTPATAASNLFTTVRMIASICYEPGTCTIASKMGGAADATTCAFAFAA